MANLEDTFVELPSWAKALGLVGVLVLLSVGYYMLVHGSIAIPEDQLLKLAEERALAVKGYLVTEAGLPPDRAVVGQPELDKKDSTFGGVELAVET